MSQLYVYDFTIKYSDDADLQKLKEWCKEWCKHWCFQLEKGEETGYKHWQGRISLIKKKRIGKVIKITQECFPSCHVSATSGSVAKGGSMSYVMKADTRIDGPWSDKDVDIYIPTKYVSTPEWYPWQQYVIDSIDEPTDRDINVIIDETGNKGKTTLAMWLGCRNKARRIPPMNSAKDISRMVYDTPTSKCYIIDMPRAMDKRKLSEMYTAIEEIKNGHVYDDRYHFKEKYFDSPTIWVFTNIKPDLELLSASRWNLYSINQQKQLHSL